jgi:hypothetical protein
VHFAGLSEKMTIEVVVACDGNDRNVQEAAIARAKDFARRFASPTTLGFNVG